MVPVTINQLWGVDLEFSDQDLTLIVDQFGERYLQSAAERLANMVDGDGCDQYINVFNLAGTPGVLPSDLTTYTNAGVTLADSACPKGTSRSLIISPRMEAAALGFRNNLFNPPKEISEQYLTGKMGTAVGFKWSMDQNTSRQIVGTLGAATPVVNGANQSGNLLVTNGWVASTSTVNQGDIISVVGMDSVNPVSYRDTGSYRTFVVTSTTTADGSGNMSIPISPDIDFDPTSTSTTVLNAPPNGAAILVYGVAAANFSTITGLSSAQGLAFHKQAFALCIVRQELPGGIEWSELVTDPKTGLTARLTRDWDPRNNDKLTRFEILGGWATLRPEFACRIAAN